MTTDRADEESSEHFFLALDEPSGSRSVVFEEDGRTCYLYPLESGKIVSTVWLYNCPGQPDDPSWDNPDELPFANRRRNIVPGETMRLSEESDIVCHWDRRGVSVTVDGISTACLVEDVDPGWSRLVAVDSALAKRLSDAPKA